MHLGCTFGCMGCISDTSDLIMLLLLFALHSNCSIFLPFCIVRQRFHILLPLYLCICNWKRWSVFVKTLENIVSRTPSVPFSINFNAQCVSYRYIRRQFQNLSPSYCIRVRHWLRLQFHWDVADRISTFFLPSSIHSSIHSLLACSLQFRSLFNLFFRGPNKGAQNSGRIEQKRTDSRRLCCCCRTQESERKCTKTNINARILEKKCKWRKRRGNNINPGQKPKQKKTHVYVYYWHFLYFGTFPRIRFVALRVRLSFRRIALHSARKNNTRGFISILHSVSLSSSIASAAVAAASFALWAETHPY